MKEIAVKHGEIIYESGDLDDKLFYVLSGNVETFIEGRREESETVI